MVEFKVGTRACMRLQTLHECKRCGYGVWMVVEWYTWGWVRSLGMYACMYLQTKNRGERWELVGLLVGVRSDDPRKW